MNKSIRKHIGFALLCIFCSIILAKEQETSAPEGNVIYKQSFDALEDLKIEPNGNFLIDTVLKQEGKGALHVQWPGNGKTANTSKTIILNVPEFDATDCVVRVWLRYDNISSRQTSITLVDDADKPSYKWIWAHNESCINVWKLLEFHVGGAKQPGGTWKYGPDEAGGDIRKTVAVQITFWALNDVEKGCNGDHYIDGMEIIRPVKIPSETIERLHKFNADSPEVIESRSNDMVRVSYAPLLKIEGSAQLKADKENKGDAEKWFSLSLDDTAWNKGRVGSFWLPENDPVAWYRIRFEAPQLPEGRKISLVFGAVDESAWVWLNGEKLGSHSEDSKDGWDEPFAFDVTGRIKSGKENLLTVKVLNRAQAGGIFRPIVLAEEKNVKVLGSVPVIVKYDPWKDPDVKKEEEKILRRYAERRLPVTPPPPARHYAPKSIIRDREMLFTTTEFAGLGEPNSKVSWDLPLKTQRSVALTLDFSETSFKGAAIKCTVNGMILPAYFALGEDTRYAEAKKTPDLSPPESKIQANWVLPPEWGGKHLKIEILNAGPGWTVPERFTVSAVDGDNIPGFQNSVPVSMDIWFRQGRPDFDASIIRGGFGEEVWNKLITGIIPSSRAVAHESISSDGKNFLSPEDMKVGYGFGKVRWYTMWALLRSHLSIVETVDSGNNQQMQEIKLRSRDGVRANIEGWMKNGYSSWSYPSWDYVDMLTLLLEVGNGINTWNIESKYGYTPRVAAEAWVQSEERVKSLLNEQAPWVSLESEHNFMPAVEEWIYKVPTQQLGHKGKDYIDSLNDHCFSNHFPDIVMKMNRYRMNRSEKDLLAKNLPVDEVTGENFMIGVVGGGLSPVNSKDMKSDGADTKPLDYRCGFDGDEELSNDETVGWGGSSSTYLQGDSTAYNFLNGLIAYSLLPTAAADKRDSVKTYGEWVDGPFHTQRLQTRDPLFGDLFGFNRWEYCASGDCNSMRGPISPWARIGAHDAFSALRRACLSFQLDGSVYPVRINNPDSENLIIKAVTGMFEWTPVTELAAVNQDGKEHLLDITLYVGNNNPVEALILDDKAARKHDAQRVTFTPVNGEINYKTAVPALRAWQLIIFNKEGDVSAWTGAPSVPLATAPLRDADLTQQPVVLKWQLSPSSNNCVIQLAKEAIFSDKHIVKEEIITGQEYTVPSELLKDKTRLWWRVRAVNKNGVGSAWSVPRPFCYQWPERAKLMKEMGENKKRLNDAEDNVWLKTNIRERELGLDKDRNNAVSRATLVTSNAVYPGPPSGAAVDFSFESVWTAPLPATWTLIWDKPEIVHNIRIYWHEKMIGNNYRILGKVDDKWLELLNVKGNTQTDARHELEKPVSIFQLQLEIQSASDEQGKTVKYGKMTNQPGIRELRVD